MSVEDLNVFQSSSKFTNGTKDKNYFTVCNDHPTAPLIWAGFSVFCSLLGLPASVKVLQQLCQRRRQNNTNDFFVFNLTVIDLAFLCILPLDVGNYIVWHNIEFECFCNFLYSLPLSGSPLFMACVCGDYYFAVVHPITYMTSKRTAMIRKAIAMMIWLFMSGFGYLIALQTWIITTTFASTPLFIALPVICFCDISVFRALRRKDPSGKTTVHPQKKRAMRTIISSFVMTFTAYLPPALIFLMGNNIPMSFDDYYCVFVYLAVCFMVLGSVIMPFLYLESIGPLNLRKMVEKIKLRG